MKSIWIIVISLCLGACGGTGAPVVHSTVSGTAATGAGISGVVSLEDADGHEVHANAANGSFSVVVDGLTPPYLLRAQWSAAGATQTLYSFAAAPGTANITPLTDLAMRAAVAGQSLDTLYAAPSSAAFGALALALPVATHDLQVGLAPLLASYSVSNLNPFSGAFAADHTGMDALLDAVTVTVGAGEAVVADAASGATILDAAPGDLAHALTVPAWTAQDAAIASDPDLAVDASGNGLAVWAGDVSTSYAIQARFVTVPGAAVVTVSTAGIGTAPRVAFDAAGDALVVWLQSQGLANDVWARRYDAASQTWGAPVQVSAANAPAAASGPADIAVDAAGNAVALWAQGDGRVNHFDMWSATYSAATGAWSAPALVSDGVNSAYGGRLAVDAAGQGIVAWRQEQGDGTTVSNAPTDVWARRFGTDGSWGAAGTINTIPAAQLFVYGQIAVAVDATGNATALWVQGTIQAAMLPAAGVWQPSQSLMAVATDSAYGPDVAFDAAGDAVAVWQEQDGVGAFGGGSRYVAGVGWSPLAPFAVPAAGDVYLPRVAVDGAGNATAVWYQVVPGMPAQVYSTRASAAGSWGAAQVLAPTTTDGFSTYPVPVVAANAAGRTVAVWGVDSD